MAEEIAYAELAVGPGKRRQDLHSLPQPGTSGCPQWHRAALWTGWTGNVLLGAAVVAMGCSQDEGCMLCPMNWTLRGPKCYWVSDGIRPWNASREDCGNRGAELLMLGDQDELDFLNKSLQKRTSYFWIGLSAGKGWTWLNGSRLDLSRFRLSPLAEGGSCGVIKEGRISSEGCGSALPWICQKEATQL
ncbi:killer cell lectin-like receptor subfamily B member 1B allele B isoform 3-T3 [Alca torda]